MTTYNKIKQQKDLQVPKDWLQIKTIDMHTGGEPLRVVVDGFPPLEGDSVLAYRRYCRDNFDHLRTALMFEPRGHADMYGCILVPPNDDGADFGVLFIHNEGYSTMCGHAIIALATLAVQMHWIIVQEGENVLKIDAPCGRIVAYVNVFKGAVQDVKFHCVPSFVVGLDRTVQLPNIGQVTYDLAYGGAFYAYVDLHKNPNLALGLQATDYRALIQQGMAIKNAVMANDQEIQHPFEADLSFLYGTIFIGDALAGNDSRNVCIFAEGEVDRCPTGSGVSGRMAIHWVRKEIALNQEMTIESITGSVFKGSVVAAQDYGPFSAVTPQVAGTAHITGMHTFVIDPKDPMAAGFIFR